MKFLSAYLRRGIPAFLLPFAILQAQPVKLNVTTPDSVLSRFIDRGFLQGRVCVEGTTIPLGSAVVTLSDQPVDTPVDAGTWIMRSTTDTSGWYQFGLVPEGRYDLEVECAGYFPYSRSVWIEGQEQLKANIELVPDYSHSSIHTTGSLVILTTDRSTGEPIEGARVFFQEGSYVETDASGAGYVHHLQPRWYDLYVTAEGYRDRSEDSVNIKAGSSLSYEAELQETTISRDDLLCRQHHHLPYPVTMIDPSRYCSLTGSVVDVDAMEYVPFVQVFLAPFGVTTETDSAGTFLFRGLRPGTYCVTVRVPGFDRTTVHEIDLAAGKRRNIRVAVSRHDNFGRE